MLYTSVLEKWVLNQTFCQNYANIYGTPYNSKSKSQFRSSLPTVNTDGKVADEFLLDEIFSNV